MLLLTYSIIEARARVNKGEGVVVIMVVVDVIFDLGFGSLASQKSLVGNAEIMQFSG